MVHKNVDVIPAIVDRGMECRRESRGASGESAILASGSTSFDRTF